MHAQVLPVSFFEYLNRGTAEKSFIYSHIEKWLL